MKRMWMVGVLALLVGAVAATPAGAASNNDFAVGGGAAGTMHFAFSAHLGPNGPSGHAVVRDPALGEAQGPVICFEKVSTQAARFAIENKKGSGFFGSGQTLGVFVAEFGSGDVFVAGPVFGPPSPGCMFNSGLGGSVSKGNIVIK